MNRTRSILVTLAFVLASAGLLVVLVRHQSAKTSAGQIRAAAKKSATQPSAIAKWKPTPAQQSLIDQAATATPDPFSDDIVHLLAGIPEDDRKLVFFGTGDPRIMRLTARAWALRDGVVQGDEREVAPFLKVLDEPFEVDLDQPDVPAETDDRNVSLVALENAVIAGGAHRARFGHFERIAIEHLKGNQTIGNALLLLYLLDEQNGLSDQGKKALAQWSGKAPYKDRLPLFAKNTLAEFMKK